MSETGFSFSHVESPSPGASLPQGRHLIRGWVWPKPGGHFVDVRARVNERIFAGVHGLPRADLAAHFKTGRPVALAEFYIAVEWRPGEVDVVLEVLEIEGRWTAFETVRYQIAPAHPPVDFAVPSGPLRWHEFGRALQILLREKRRQPERPLPELAHEVVTSIPFPRDLRHPPAPFHGHLDEPAAVARCGFGRSAVLGYLFHETQPIKRVLATFDLQVWQSVDHLQPSPNPAGYFTAFPQAKNCALYGLIDLPAQLPAPASLRLYAELADGSLHLCSVQRSRMLGSEDEKAPYPAKSQVTFDAALDALRQAMAARDRAFVEDEEMHAEIARLAEDFRVRAPASPPATAELRLSPASVEAPLPRRMLVVTHSLDMEGAPLFLVDYVRHLTTQQVNVTVLSPTAGPLRERFEAMGARVEIVDAAAIFAASSAAAAKKLIGELPFHFAPYDLIICNTFTTFWAVHAAKAAGRRVLLYIHESTTPTSFYHSRLHPSVIALVDEAFALADRVSFTTRSTRYYHTDYGRPANHRLTPGWIDVARIDAWRAENPREKTRARFALEPGELLVTNVGTVSGRKGQHIFARAVDLLWQRHPDLAARTQFVMLGGRHSPFDDMLGELLGQLGHANLTVHAETADYFPYYAAADLFVCSSFEESSPRVILETMAFGTPILSSNVQGVPELVRPELEAMLIPPGDTVALCEGMARLLRSPEIGQSLAKRARARVIAEFEAGSLLTRHAALAAEVAAG